MTLAGLPTPVASPEAIERMIQLINTISDKMDEEGWHGHQQLRLPTDTPRTTRYVVSVRVGTIRPEVWLTCERELWWLKDLGHYGRQPKTDKQVMTMVDETIAPHFASMIIEALGGME